MNRFFCTIALLVLALVGCGQSKEESGDASKSKEVTVTVPSLDGAVDKLKQGVQETTEAAKKQLAESAGAEIERIYGELQGVANDFTNNADKLQGDAKEQFEKVRIEFEEKKKVFDEKLKEFKSGSGGAKDELLKGLYEALADMKKALDKAAEAYRTSVPPSAEKPA